MHLNKGLAAGIRTIGFRRWYQRELLSGHAHLVLLLLAVVGVMGCLEVMPTLTAAERLLYGCYVLACAAIGVWALRRYLYLLMRAEAIANQANCPRCGAYGRLRLTQGPHRSGVTRVQCRGCAHEWDIEE
ncbi:MAG: hypothetical protein ACKOJ7_08765 [Betaproteobacteria bacterium]